MVAPQVAVVESVTNARQPSFADDAAGKVEKVVGFEMRG